MDSEQEAQEPAKRNLKKVAEAVVETIPSDTKRTVSFTLCARKAKRRNR
jgi:hypothetical protein